MKFRTLTRQPLSILQDKHLKVNGAKYRLLSTIKQNLLHLSFKTPKHRLKASNHLTKYRDQWFLREIQRMYQA